MNKLTLRFPSQLEKKYEEFTRESNLFHFKCYQPILIVINLGVAIIQLKAGQIANGLFESLITLFFILQIPFFLKFRQGKNVCSVFVINNLIQTVVQIWIDRNTPSYDNQYISGCGIAIMNITLLEHYDFVWNAFALIVITASRVIYILFYFAFDGMAILYIVVSLYLLILLYRKSYTNRKLFTQYQNEKEIRNVLNEIIEDIYIQFKFDLESFQFQLKYANSYAEQRLGISCNQDFKDFLHQYSIFDPIQQQKLQSKFNQNLIRSIGMDSQSIGQFLYEKMITSKTPSKKLVSTIQKISSQQQYNIKIFAYQNESLELLMMMEQKKNILHDDVLLKLKEQEIKLLSNKLDKINTRTNKQLQQLCQLQQNSEDKYYFKVSESLINGQIISNTKIKMILDGFYIYYFKNSSSEFSTFSLQNLVYQSLILMNTVADVENKSIQFEQNLPENFIVTSVEQIIKFIFSNLLYIVLIQKSHEHIKIELSNLEREQCFAFNFYIDGFISNEFLKQNTFIIQMIYKGLKIVGPKAEIKTTSYLQDNYPQLLQVIIYKNLDFVINE